MSQAKKERNRSHYESAEMKEALESDEKYIEWAFEGRDIFSRYPSTKRREEFYGHTTTTPGISPWAFLGPNDPTELPLNFERPDVFDEWQQVQSNKRSDVVTFSESHDKSISLKSTSCENQTEPSTASFPNKENTDKDMADKSIPDTTVNQSEVMITTSSNEQAIQKDMAEIKLEDGNNQE